MNYHLRSGTGGGRKLAKAIKGKGAAAAAAADPDPDPDPAAAAYKKHQHTSKPAADQQQNRQQASR